MSEALIEPIAVELVGGFHAQYFDVDQSLSTVDDVDWEADPNYEEMVAEIDYEDGSESFWQGGDTDTFGARLTGEVTVEEAGTHEIELRYFENYGRAGLTREWEGSDTNGRELRRAVAM